MQRYEFKVIPAPRRGEKSRMAKTTEERFALALSTVMNQMGAEGWDYVRADVLPCDERAGITGGVKTSFQNMLVFRRVLGSEGVMPSVMAESVPALRGVIEPEAVPAAPPLRLGAAEQPAGLAPPVGPVKPELAAE